MCGRFGLTKTLSELKARYGAQGEFPFNPNFNVCPTHIMPVLVDTPSGREIKLMRWGLLPIWAKDKKDGAKMINARGETVAEKPAYRAAFKSHRCIVPASGFYEWKLPDMRPFWFHPREQELFSFCGIWSTWRSPESESIDTFSILTTAANDLVAQVHDRMPVAIGDNTIGQWLAADTRLLELQQFLVPYPGNQTKATEVGKYVNNVKNKGAACLLPMNSI